MQVVRFQKDYAAKVMSALNVGLSIPAPPEGWTEDALMTLAGAVHAELHRRPKHTWAMAGAAAERHMRGGPPDTREHDETARQGDIFLGTDFVATACDDLAAGQFEGRYTPEFTAAIYCDAEDRNNVVPVAGMMMGITPAIHRAEPPALPPPEPTKPKRRGKR